MINFSDICSVHDLPGANSSAIFIPESSSIFREQCDSAPLVIGPSGRRIMPWGNDNQLPYDIIDKVESDETLSTCMLHMSEVLYGDGLRYEASETTPPRVVDEANDFVIANDLPGYHLGVSYDFKYFGFAVTEIILSLDCTKVVSISRLHACYCRFEEADARGRINNVYVANWRDGAPLDEDKIEVIPLLDARNPLGDLRSRIKSGARCCKYAVAVKIPTVDSTYYPIPHYGALFRSKWYDIKRLIGVAKEAKLRNSAPIKYQIEISEKHWLNAFKQQGITSPEKQREFVNAEKRRIIEFLTGAENSGKALFSTYFITPDGREVRDVRITKIDTATQGGDWATDIQEAVNMICFAMRVHSNLVGSVPGKGQTNNSGSDKRELYTIAQAMQKPYRDLLFVVHRMIIAFNGWQGIYPVCPFMQLTTLDEHRDAKLVTDNSDD